MGSLYLYLFSDNVMLCAAAVQKINEVFSTVNDEFEEFSYSLKVYRHATCFLNICTLTHTHFQSFQELLQPRLGQLALGFGGWILI